MNKEPEDSQKQNQHDEIIIFEGARIEKAHDQGYHQAYFRSAALSEGGDFGFDVGGNYFHFNGSFLSPNVGERICSQYVLNRHNSHTIKYYS